MKKFLSLVLALVMTMSLVTMAGAEDFTDAADVDYAEAVEVLTATGVVSGYTDGSVRPDVALNRGQAAKIICNLILGPTAASALPTSVAPYADVPAGSTFAGYIAYLAKEGLVSGYADGTFQPTAPLTGYAFMKMLLGVIGYDAAIEGYTGSNWAVSVAKQALAQKLYKGLEGDFVGTKTVTRQEAMLYAFNALKAEYVEYTTKGTNITIGGVVVSTGASEAAKNDDGTAGATLKYYEKLFDGELYIDTTTPADDFGRPATTWVYDDEEIGTFPVKADLVVTTNEKLYAVNKGLKKGTNDQPNLYWVRNVGKAGTDNDLSSASLTLNYYGVKDTNKLNEIDVLAAYAGNGVTVEFFYDKDDNTINNRVVVIDEFIAEIADVKTDADDKTYVQVAGYEDYYTDDFAKGDWVLVTAAWDGSALEIQSMKKAEKLSGKLTKEHDGVYTIGGVEYKTHKNASLTATTAGYDVDFYLDSFGYIIKIEAASKTAAVENLGVVLAKEASSFGSYEAKVVYGSGKMEYVTLKDANTATNQVYSFSTESGKLKVSGVTGYTSYYSTPGSAYYLVKGATKITDADGVGFIDVNNSTTFVYIDKNDNVAVYNGVSNAPAFAEAAQVYAYKKTAPTAAKSALIVFVVMGNGTTSSSVSDLLYIVMKDYKLTNTVKEGTTDARDYYVVKDLAGNEYKFDNGITGSIEASASYYTNAGVKVYKALTKNDEGIITYAELSEKANYYDGLGTTIEAVDGVVYGMAGAPNYTYASDVEVYTINKDAVVAKASISGLKQKVAGYTYILDANNQIEMLILKTV